MSESTKPYAFEMRRRYDVRQLLQTFLLLIQLAAFVFYGGRIVERMDNLALGLQEQKVSAEKQIEKIEKKFDAVEGEIKRLDREKIGR